MKYLALKIKIRRKENGDNWYPAGHNAVEVDQFGIGMHNDSDGCDWDKDGFRYGFAALPEDRAQNYIKNSEPGLVEVVSADEAEAWFATHRPEPSELLDSTKLLAIKLKQDLKIPLTQEDQDALNPDKIHVSGIVKNVRKGFRGKLPKDAEV